MAPLPCLLHVRMALIEYLWSQLTTTSDWSHPAERIKIGA